METLRWVACGIVLVPVFAMSEIPETSRAAAEVARQKAFHAFDSPARELLAKMTLEEKIGQM